MSRTRSTVTRTRRWLISKLNVEEGGKVCPQVDTLIHDGHYVQWFQENNSNITIIIITAKQQSRHSSGVPS